MCVYLWVGGGSALGELLHILILHTTPTSFISLSLSHFISSTRWRSSPFPTVNTPIDSSEERTGSASIGPSHRSWAAATADAKEERLQTILSHPFFVVALKPVNFVINAYTYNTRNLQRTQCSALSEEKQARSDRLSTSISEITKESCHTPRAQGLHRGSFTSGMFEGYSGHDWTPAFTQRGKHDNKSHH